MIHHRTVLLLFFLITTGLTAQGIGEPAPPEYPRETREGIEELYRMFPAKKTYTHLSGELDTAGESEWESRWFYVKEGAGNKVNFGGKYIIIQWGCGTSCQSGAMIDAETGNVYRLPTSEWGKEFRDNSFLLIVNPPEDEQAGGAELERPDWAYPAYYVWKDGGFVLLKDTRKE